MYHLGELEKISQIILKLVDTAHDDSNGEVSFGSVVKP